jgi:hypothetical protein
MKKSWMPAFAGMTGWGGRGPLPIFLGFQSSELLLKTIRFRFRTLAKISPAQPIAAAPRERQITRF